MQQPDKKKGTTSRGGCESSSLGAGACLYVCLLVSNPGLLQFHLFSIIVKGQLLTGHV